MSLILESGNLVISKSRASKVREMDFLAIEPINYAIYPPCTGLGKSLGMRYKNFMQVEEKDFKGVPVKTVRFSICFFHVIKEEDIHQLN